MLQPPARNSLYELPAQHFSALTMDMNVSDESQEAPLVVDENGQPVLDDNGQTKSELIISYAT